MATIEERARQYATNITGGLQLNGAEGDVWQASYDTYVEIATEQRKIDIDFVRFWLCDHVVGTTLTVHDIQSLTKVMEE